MVHTWLSWGSDVEPGEWGWGVILHCNMAQWIALQAWVLSAVRTRSQLLWMSSIDLSYFRLVGRVKDVCLPLSYPRDVDNTGRVIIQALIIEHQPIELEPGEQFQLALSRSRQPCAHGSAVTMPTRLPPTPTTTKPTPPGRPSTASTVCATVQRPSPSRQRSVLSTVFEHSLLVT